MQKLSCLFAKVVLKKKERLIEITSEDNIFFFLNILHKISMVSSWNSYPRFISRLMWAIFFVFVFWNIWFISTNSTKLDCPVPMESTEDIKKDIENQIETNIESNVKKIVSETKPVNCPTLPPLPTPPKPFKFEDVACFRFPNTNQTPIMLLESVMESKRMPRKGESIFFVETSCSKDGVINLNPR